jgi:hypothetical protein
MAHVVVKVARNAGIVALFIVAAMLGISAACCSRTRETCRRFRRSTTTSPSTSPGSTQRGQVIGEFATQRRVVVGYDDINPGSCAGDHRHRGLPSSTGTSGVNIWRIGRRGGPSISRSGGARRARAR